MAIINEEKGGDSPNIMPDNKGRGRRYSKLLSSSRNNK
jgi:hypothetical protein